jgi:hypothetical protein
VEFCENYQFLCDEGSYLLLPFEDFWVPFLLGWDVEAMLCDVILLGVMDRDWALFSLDTFPCCLYNSVALCNVSPSQFPEAGLLFSLSLSLARCLLIKELLKPTSSKCSQKIPLGLNHFILSAYVRFNFLKWTAILSILLTFLQTRSPTFQGRGMNFLFFLSWKKCNQWLCCLAISATNIF